MLKSGVHDEHLQCERWQGRLYFKLCIPYQDKYFCCCHQTRKGNAPFVHGIYTSLANTLSGWELRIVGKYFNIFAFVIFGRLTLLYGRNSYLQDIVEGTVTWWIIKSKEVSAFLRNMGMHYLAYLPTTLITYGIAQTTSLCQCLIIKCLICYNF